MRFEQVTIENFGVYYGRVILDFNLGRTRNICLVDGNNGWGKTTLHKAIRFCFYGARNSRSEQYEFINHRAIRQGQKNMMVQIQFAHNSKHYQVTRSVEADDKKRTDESFTVLVDGKPAKSPMAVLDEILPYDASQFFFFDGEDIQRYTSLDNPVDTREAIELVLGIPAIRNAIEHMEKVESIVGRKLIDEQTKDMTGSALARDIKDLSDKIDKQHQELQALREKRDEMRTLLEDIERKLQKTEAAEETLREIEKNRREIKDHESSIAELRKREKEDLSKLPYLMIGNDLRAALTTERGKMSRFREGLQDRNRLEGAVYVLGTLKQGENCFCGTPITKGELVFIRKHLEHYTDRLKELGAAQELDLVQLQRLERAVGIVDGIKVNLRSIEQEKREHLNQIDDLEAENKKLEDKLKLVGTEEVKKLTGTRDRLLKELSATDRDLEWTENAIENLRVMKGQKERELERISPDTPQRAFLASELDLVRRAAAALREYLDATAEDKRHRIQAETSEVHRNLTNKPEVYAGVRINPDYTFEIVDRNGEPVPNKEISPGEKEILALSFIAGLNRSTDREAPVVMDTPFARLDQEHKNNVLRYLPKLGAQVTILATDMDINQDNIGMIQEHIGKRYVIDFDMKNMSSTIREEK